MLGYRMTKSANQTISVQIRDARPDDQVAIRELTLAAYQEYAAQFPAHWENYRQNILATLALAGSAEQIVAEQNGTILGSTLLFPSGIIGFEPDGAPVTSPCPELRLLAVAPSSRGQGIGAALMEECVRRARASGAAVLTLHTTDMMQTALRLYERMGFVRASELDFQPASDLTVKGYRLTLEGLSRKVTVIDRLPQAHSFRRKACFSCLRQPRFPCAGVYAVVEAPGTMRTGDRVARA